VENQTEQPATPTNQYQDWLTISWLRPVLLALTWLAVWHIGVLVEYIEHASVWFPAAGLTFAALLVAGYRAILPLMVSAVLVTIWTAQIYDLPLSITQLLKAGVLFGIAHIFPYYIGSKLLCWLTLSRHFNAPQLIVTFLLTATVISLIATVLVLASLVLSGMMPFESIADTWLAFWIGDMAGVMVLAPLFSAVLFKLYPDTDFNLKHYINDVQIRWSNQYKYKMIAIALLIMSCMYLAHLTQTPKSAYAIFFLVIPHMWIACTESALVNVLSIALSSFLIAFGVNFFGLVEMSMVFQFAINVVAANTLFCLAVPTLISDNQKLRQLVLYDSLTQAASRDHLIEQANLQIKRSQKGKIPLALIVFDIDNFKRINDQFGHAGGDNILVKVSHTAKSSLRPTDLLARFGGDEFVALLPNSDEVAALCVAERVRTSLHHIEIEGQHVSSSFGVSFVEQNDTFESLFERADKALYLAKQQGKNRVVKLTTNGSLNVLSNADVSMPSGAP
jgi:diguanylate cyclase (GGDEF)-like protein